ncbi:MAG: hypothetical protein HETSPECPRED_008273 [Heterodermia speciosa]|uniref:Enoyl reductase (ER) domain-containing protein n=1 Tax=Heterodermia speciosa TaxID=116794 RepID=A0A8H3G2Q3_9LECA|nr:MAG: hypothetical protein HETSPECPRED_008273 [Heterodermia speciosa]
MANERDRRRDFISSFIRQRERIQRFATETSLICETQSINSKKVFEAASHPIVATSTPLSQLTMPKASMLALRLTAKPSSKAALALESLPIPTATADHNNVVIKVEAAAINPSDILNANGGFEHTTLPRTLGRDYAGTVIDGPADLTGQEVYGTSGNALGFTLDGTHAQYCIVPRTALASKPSNLSFAQAATVGVPFTTAALILRRAVLRSGEVVLVLGASGAVGSAVSQLAERRGCRVLRAARRDNVDVNLAADPEMESARVLTGGKGPDVVVDTVGDPDLTRRGLMSLAIGGRLVFISAPKKGSTDMTFDMKYVYRHEISIVGCNSALADIGDTAKDMDEMRKGFEDGSLQTAKEEDLHMIGMEEVVEVYEEQLRTGYRKNYVIRF